MAVAATQGTVMTGASRLAATLLVGSIAMATSAHAQEATTEAGPSDRWSFTLAPYLWMIELDGNATVGGIKTDVDVPFKDSIKDLSFGGMLLGTVRKGRFGFSLNGVYTRVSPDDEVGGVDIDTTSDLASVAASPFYRVVDWTYRESADGTPRRFFLEPYAGARWNYLRVELEIRGGRQFDQNQSWVDPIVGTRFGVDLTDNLILAGAGDVGGVVTGSDFAWNVQGYLGYQTELFGRETVLSVGYRALHTDYDHDNFKWDVTQHGPILGTAIRF
jgi:hypothetical protein